MALKMSALLLLLALVLVGVRGAEGEGDGDGDLLQQLTDTTHVLARQLMLERFYTQEKIRSEGCSGIKQVRHQRDGTRPYFTETHTGSGVASIHDHADSVRTMGMGEFHVVLNGVEFRTRHNDYLLKMPSTTTNNYHEIEDVPMPDVPPSVLEKTTVTEQIEEMRMYFKAFKEQDTSLRDYRPYFKPLLSYLEGAWTLPEGEELEEPFPGERHWIEAKTWKELEDKVMFTGYSGNKEALENYAWLPRAVFGVNNASLPQLAQWNYRILCHPLNRDLPTARMRVIDDLVSRMVTRQSLQDIIETREARFTLTPTDADRWSHGRYVGTLLDELMQEIPGKDNYNADLTDEAFGVPATETQTDKPINTGFYHHLFKYDGKDGMGMNIRHRGFSDETLFMAMTTQEKIAGMNFYNCMNTWVNKTNCEDFNQKWSYAFPMEIIYLTPLHKWNPYDIHYYGWSKKEEEAKRVTANGRNGSLEAPYDGTNSINYFRTPAEFFGSDDEYSVRPADTTGSDVYVLDSQGIARRVRASGHRMFIPNIPGVGRVRQRYPIMPVHYEGNTIWKELEALKDIVLASQTFAHMHYGVPEAPASDAGSDGFEMEATTKLYMGPANQHYGSHVHELDLTQLDKDLLLEGGVVQTTSSLQNGHQHQLSLALEPYHNGQLIRILRCDSKVNCWDGHNLTFVQGFTNNGTIVKDLYEWVNVQGHTAGLGNSVALSFYPSVLAFTLLLSTFIHAIQRSTV